ncbi:MAG: glycosyltransferase [Ilumatobacteraceae bacterium]|nr:glycosyltransferase [Ilumatobacteraceae bacterium]
MVGRDAADRDGAPGPTVQMREPMVQQPRGPTTQVQPCLVSIITAVAVDASDHLPASYRSILQQRLPAGWGWEWLVHVDGGDPPPWIALTGDGRIRVSANERNFGPALTRNLLLARSTGTYLKVLDGDDQLMPGAIARDIQAVESFPGATWVTSRARDLLDDGSFAHFANAPAAGLLERGTVFEYWKSHDRRLPVHPATLFVHRAAVLALGGWAGIPTSEDTGLLLALNCQERGVFVDEVGLTYRKWSKQLTGQDHHSADEDSQLRSSFIQQRCELLLRLA